MDEVKGYKVFNPDWTCRGFQYEVGKIFEEDVVVTEVFIFVKTLLIVSAITVLILKIKLQKLLHLAK